MAAMKPDTVNIDSRLMHTPPTNGQSLCAPRAFEGLSTGLDLRAASLKDLPLQQQKESDYRQTFVCRKRLHFAKAQTDDQVLEIALLKTVWQSEGNALTQVRATSESLCTARCLQNKQPVVWVDSRESLHKAIGPGEIARRSMGVIQRGTMGAYPEPMKLWEHLLSHS
eukprot:1258509-Amphidinium_carterae.1